MILNKINLTILMLGFIFITSCKTEGVTDVEIKPIAVTEVQFSASKVKSELKQINHKYADNSISRLKSWRDIARITMADLIGVRLGVWAGSWAGPWGSAAGALVCGVGGSYLAGQAPDVTDNQYALVDNIVNYDVSYTIDNPNSNPYDINIGKRHNQILKMMVKQAGFNRDVIDDHFFDDINLTTDENNMFNTKVQELEIFGNSIKSATSLQLLEQMSSNYIPLTDVVVLVTQEYNSGMMEATYENVLQLSQDYENYVMSSSVFSTEEKNAMLTVISLGKYSSKFWYDNLN